MKALVLSAGGSFGAYQVGAWLALRERGWQPDLIVAASVGAVNGLAISRGATEEDLLTLWRELPRDVYRGAEDMLRPGGRRVPLRKRAALFRVWVRRIFDRWAARPWQRDLLVTMTELPSCAVLAVPGSELTCQHLLASCAVPTVMPPIKIAGRLYVDGGTFCPLPLRQAITAGATEIVAVDLLAEPPCRAIRWARVAGASVRNALRREPTEPTPGELSRVRLCRVHAPRPLGSLDDCFTWEPKRADSLIELGYRHAHSALPAAWGLEPAASSTAMPVPADVPVPANQTGSASGQRRQVAS